MKPGLALAVLLWAAAALPAENIVFPADGGVIDVTRPPYNAKGDGKTDDTKAIQAALSATVSANTIVYLPNGTYLVSDTLRWPFRMGSDGRPEAGSMAKRTILQGQSMARTVVKLRDGAEGFADPKHPKGVIHTGEAPAQRFRNAIRNLTVSTGRGNPGATGVQFIANNQGTMRMVTIRSEDGKGVAGLDMRYTNEVGPCLIQDVKVTGFDIGVWTGNRVDSQTFERVMVENQNTFGLRNDGQVISIRGFTSRNQVPAIFNASGFLTLIDGDMTSEIRNTGAMFVRDAVREEVSHPGIALFGGAARSLRLPVKETPAVPWDALSEWANPVEYGAKLNDTVDDTAAIQKAIDSGKTTVYLPNGTLTLDGTLHVRGKVRRIIGLEGKLRGNGTIQFDDGDSPVVVMERFEIAYSPITIVHAASRTLVLSSVTMEAYRNTGRGDLFLEDVVGAPFTFERQNVWARQLNIENAPRGEIDYKALNRGGRLWVLGLKTERDGYVVKNVEGAATEIVGGFIYSNHRTPPVHPMLGNFDSAMSASLSECTFGDRHTYGTLVRETRQGVTKELLHDDAPPSGCATGRMLPIYAGGAASKESK